MLESPVMVGIGQFYGIEINDFAVAVGKTALWIAEQQMLERTQELLPFQTFDFLPLKANPNIVCANALRMDWNDVLLASGASYCESHVRNQEWEMLTQDGCYQPTERIF